MAHVNDKYWKSKIPLWVALLFLLNLFLIVAVELLAIYKYPIDVDEAVLSRWDPAYAGCTVISQDERSTLSCYLVETADGEARLVTSKIHPIFHSRTRILSDLQITRPENEDHIEIQVKTGLQPSIVHVYRYMVDLQFVHVTTVKDTTIFYTIAAALLEFAELGIWEIIKRNMR